MSLDLTDTALQIDGMARELRARHGDRALRIQNAREAADSFDVAEYEAKRQDSKGVLTWNAPVALDSPGKHYAPPSPPVDFCVVAVDGSHIDVDRHIPARCFLINIGVSILTYGSNPDARLFNQPRLYASDDELVIRDGSAYHREQAIQGALLGAKRTVQEIAALAEVVRDLPPDLPTVALMDGSLIMLDLVRTGFPDFVIRQLIDEGFLKALEDLRLLAVDRPLAVASYISLPRSTEVMNALRVKVCPYEVADCSAKCGLTAPGQRPCDEAAEGLMDRDLFGETLESGHRSGLFGSPSHLVASYYREHGLEFFYVNTGEEIGRMEVPSWVAEDEAKLGLAHSLIVDQCRRGPGYPVALMEAHEQAVVTTADRRNFAQLVEEALYDQRMPVYTSEKSRSKRLRWL
jgi:GNAT superfamily N-acetyltransferase